MKKNEMGIFAHLKQSRYLENLPEDCLRELLSLIEYASFPQGARVVAQGERNSKVFFIIEGSVQVTADEQPLYSLARKGDIFGELSIVSNQPSQVSVEVLSDLQALTISPDSFESIQQDRSHRLSQVFYNWLARILADKLHLTSEKAKRFENINAELQASLEAQKRTSKKLAEMTAELKRSKAELEELNQLKNEFIGIASHDLRSPISSVIAVMETIPNCYSLDAEVVEVLQSVQQTCQEQLQLVNDLLDVARIESGALELDKTALSGGQFSAFLKQSCERYRLLARNKQIELRYTEDLGRKEIPSEADRPLIKLDLPKVQQVLNNLLSNAIKFTPEGGRIELSAKLDARQIKIDISDTGVGINADDMPLIFDKFRQVKGRKLGTRGEKGAGLGLAICKNLIELHQGRIWVDSVEGQGSSFSFTLPILES